MEDLQAAEGSAYSAPPEEWASGPPNLPLGHFAPTPPMDEDTHKEAGKVWTWARLGWTDVGLEFKCKVKSTGRYMVIPYEPVAPHKGGVYVFMACDRDSTSDQRVIYVGQTHDLRDRMGEYATSTFPSDEDGQQERRVAGVLLSYLDNNDPVELYVAAAASYEGEYTDEEEDSDSYDPDDEADRLALEGVLVREFIAEGYEVINAAALP
jgi:hypothetical protein